MKIVSIIGTEVKGCTYHLKETFLKELNNHEIIEFYLPKDNPFFCCGCKNCFIKGEEYCPHFDSVSKIYNAILEADLIVFSYPVYVMRTPGQVKALLDHFACHWMVHRPDKRMFNKRAVIITQSIGAPNRSAQKDVATSLTWLGVSSIKRIGFGLMEGIIWDELSERRKNKIDKKIKSLAKKYSKPKNVRQSLKVKFLFFICKILHKKVLKKEEIISLDNQHWIENGWIKDNIYKR